MTPHLRSTRLTGAALSLALPLALAGVVAQAAPPKAKISPAQAKATAVKKIPGRAQSAKYEFEDGRWQYAVTVRSRTGQLYEAEVSATTGKVLATEKTSAAEEAREAAADWKAARSAKAPPAKAHGKR